MRGCLAAALHRPRLWAGLGAGGALALGVGALRWLSVPWLPIAIALLVLLIALLVVVLASLLVGRERREAGRAEPAPPVRRRCPAERAASAAALVRRLREGAARVRERLGDADALPWLLLLGESGAGKSSLLAESGLHWLDPPARPRVLGPTADVELRIAEQAVVLDVPGRLFAAGGDDTEEWRALLGALAGLRRERALRGIAFALPASALLAASADGLAESARQLRRALDELRERLDVDAPVYLVVTKADLLEGFSETARMAAQLHPGREHEAFGWTNERDRGPFAASAAQAFAALGERLDAGLPELVLHEPDPERRRRIFGFAQELAELAQPLAHFVDSALRPAGFDGVPFLRGIYLTSARPQGQRHSRALARLGHEWARSAPRGDERSGWFTRDLFAEVMAKDANLALPGCRRAPRVERLLAGGAAALLLAALLSWSLSFAQNLGGAQRIARSAAVARLPQVSAGELENLRQVLDAQARRARSPVHAFGYGRLRHAVERGQSLFVRAFERRFDAPLRERFGTALALSNPLPAALALSCDLAWREARAEGALCASALEPYLEGIAEPSASFASSYAAFVRWLPPRAWREQLERRRALLRAAAPALLDPDTLQTMLAQDGRYPPVEYPPALQPGGGGTSVPGLYTREAFEGPVAQLVRRLGETRAVSPEAIARFEREYAQRWDASWSRYLLGVPTAPRRDVAPHRSPYLAVIDALWTHAQTPLVREGTAPAWHGALARLRAEHPPEGEPAPWPEYLHALEHAAQDLARPDRERAAHALRGSSPTALEQAVRLVRRIAPRGEEPEVAQLRSLLELPVSQGIAARVRSGSSELDARWQREIARPFAGALDARELQELYGPQGALARFRAESLAPYLDAPGATRGSAPSFGAAFTRWLAHAERLQRALFPQGPGRPLSVVLSGRPTSGLGKTGLFATRRVLSLHCADGPQSFDYREGNPADFAFRWDSSCTSLTLRVALAGPGASEPPAQRQWVGPLALPDFLREGRRVQGGVLEWDLSRANGTLFRVRYALIAAGELGELAHRRPPHSLFGD